MILNSTDFYVHGVRIKVVVFLIRICLSVKVDRRLRDVRKSPRHSRSRCDLYLGGDGALEWVLVQRVQETLQFLALPPDDFASHAINRKSQHNGNPTIFNSPISQERNSRTYQTIPYKSAIRRGSHSAVTQHHILKTSVTNFDLIIPPKQIAWLAYSGWAIYPTSRFGLHKYVDKGRDE